MREVTCIQTMFDGKMIFIPKEYVDLISETYRTMIKLQMTNNLPAFGEEQMKAMHTLRVWAINTNDKIK